MINSSKYIKLVNDRNWLRILLGVLSGAIVGALYWKFIGCNNGTCPLTSNPYQTILIFAVMGGLFAKDDKKKQKNIENQN